MALRLPVLLYILTCIAGFAILAPADVARATTSITPTTGIGDLGTTVTQSGPLYNITQGTRLGPNLFHSFAEFSIGVGDTANFLNTPINGAIPFTSNILSRVTGGNPSNIFGTIQTTDFGSANLFLMNPAGVIFGPTATLNVGGMATFTTADYLRLAEVEGVAGIFHANPAAESILTTAPVAAFGFLGSNPAALTVQGSQLTVAEGTGLSLVGGDIAIQESVLTAPQGSILLASVASPGEVLAENLAQAPNMHEQSFSTLGAIQIVEQSVLDVSGSGGGTVLIRGGTFVLDGSVMLANVTEPGPFTTGMESIGGGIDIQMSGYAAIHNGSVIDTSIIGNGTPDATYGGVRIKADHIEVQGIIDLEAGSFIPSVVQSSVAPGSTGGNSGDIKLEGNAILLKDLAILNAETAGEGNSGNIDITTTGNLEVDSINLITTGTSSSGNSGSILLSSTQGDILLTGGPFITSQSGFLSAGTGGSIAVNAPSGTILLTGSPEFGPATLFTSMDGTGANAGKGGIQLTAKHLTIENSGIQIDNFTPFQPGDLTVNLTGTLTMRGADIFPSTLLTTTRREARSANLNILAPDIVLTDGSTVSTETFRNGDGGTLTIATNTLQVMGGAQITSNSRFNPFLPPGEPVETPSGAGGTITIQGLASPAQVVLIDGPGSGIFTDTQGTGAGGDIFINANLVMVQNGGTLSASTSGTEPTATGGTITVNAYQLSVDGGTVTVEATGAGDAGQIALITNPSGSLTGDAIQLVNSVIISSTVGDANAGDILLRTGSLHADGSFIASDASPFPGFTGGTAGNIHAEVRGAIELTNAFLSTSTTGNGDAGQILLEGNTLFAESSFLASTASALPDLHGGNGGTIRLNISQAAFLSNSTIDSQTTANGNAGNILVNADSLTLASSSLSTGTGPSEGFIGGHAGDIQVNARRLTMEDGLIVSQSLFSAGDGGTVTVNASDSIITSSTGIFPFAISTSTDGAAPFCPGTCGNAGSITLTAPTVTLNGAGLNSTTTGQGNAGNILVMAGYLSAHGGAQISASAEGPVVTGTGGNITLTAAQGVTIANGATVSASSTGPADAGNIAINAGQQLVLLNGSITTEATQASGGNIDIQAVDLVRLGDSTISASVQGGPETSGGNITIDPTVVVLQNSQIIANAVQGAGGNIFINTQLLLTDATSVISASSQFGVDGTVTIQSPISQAAGRISPLPSNPLVNAALLSQRCAALAQGEVSSFIVAGREALPLEPGGWLTSPLLASVATDGNAPMQDAPAVSGLSDDSKLLALRRLPSSWAVATMTGTVTLGKGDSPLDWFAGCGS